MDDELEPDLAQAIRASLGLPPLSPRPPPASASASGSRAQPLFLNDSDDDGNAGGEDDDDSLPDFEDAEAVDRYFGVKSDPVRPPPARAPPPPARPPPPPARRSSPIAIPRRPVQAGGWRGQPVLVDDDDDEVPVEEPEMDAELRLAMMRSKKEEEDRRAELNRIRLPIPSAAEDEEEQMRRAIEASMRPATPPPRSDDIDEDEEERFNAELRQAIELSRKERERNAATARETRTRPPSSTPPPPTRAEQKQAIPAQPTQSISEDRTGASSNANAAASALSTSSSDVPAASEPVPPAGPIEEPSRQASSSSSLFGGLSRAELEKERLARASKRQLTADDASSASDAKKPRLNSTTSSGAKVMAFGDLMKDNDKEDPAPSMTAGRTDGPSAGVGPSSSSSSSVERVQTRDRFWDGEMGFTTSSICRAPGKYFGIKELIGDTSTLKYAIISTYCLEPEWVASLFPTSVPTILVSQPPGPGTEHAGRSRHGSSVPGIWSCYPFLPGWQGGGGLGGFRGTCHMKFMLLFYNDGRMRIVISSANLMAHDWDIIENGVWVQDFRPLPTAPVKTDFGDQWEMILDSLGVGKTFKLVNPVHTNLPFTRSADIHKWDFSRVTVRLIASIGGSGKDGWSAMETVGQCRLGKVLRDEGWVAGQGRALKSLEAQGSSLGNYSPKWTSEFFKSARGLDPRNWLGTRAGTEHAPIKIIYPSLATVDATRYGRDGGGTFFCDEKKWTEKTSHMFYDAAAKRGPVLMHIKMLVAIFESSSSAFPSSSPIHPLKPSKPSAGGSSGSETEDDDTPPPPKSPVNDKQKEDNRATGWMYMGSHNFTPSAWGNCSMKKDGTPTLNTANYELGIVFPLRSSDPQQEADRLTTWKRPARKYTKSDRPWIQSEHQSVDD